MKRTSMIVILIVVIIAAAAVFAFFAYGPGNLQIQMSDPPNWGVATQVYLNYSAIEVHRADAGNESGWFTAVDNSVWINLTKTLNVNQTIGSKNLQTGLYNLIRFKILEAKVTVAGLNYTATVPSNEITVAITQGGIKVNIKINAGQTSTVLIDLNVKVQGSQTEGFRIVPAVRAVPV